MNLHTLMQDPRVWIALSFVLFTVAFVKYVLPVITKGLDSRAQTIADQLDQANRLRAEAEALLAEYQQKQEAALKESVAIVAQAEKDAAALRVKAAEELKQTITRKQAQAAANIARAEAEAIAQIRAQIIDIATETARQVIVTQLQDEKDDPAIARALQSIARQVH